MAARIRAEEALQARIAAQEAEHAALLQAHKDAEEAAASEKSDLLRAHAATENELQASRKHLDDAVALSEARAKQHAAEANCGHNARFLGCCDNVFNSDNFTVVCWSAELSVW